MKAILVATDLSPRSDRALRRAFRLAEEMDARLSVLAVIDEDLPRTVAGAMKTQAEAELAGLCASVSERDVEVLVETGEPVRTITERAAALDVDLVVLGVHRKRPFWDFIRGTTMERIVRASVRPALLVSDPVTGSYERVLAGIDLSPACEAAAQAAHRIAPGAVMRGFHATHVPYRGLVAPNESARALAPFVKEAEEELARWWEQADLPEALARPVPVLSAVQAAFDSEMQSFGPDLVAVGAHGRVAFAPSLLGSFTEGLIRTPPCDILVVRR